MEETVELTLLYLFRVRHNPTHFQVSNKEVVVVNVFKLLLSLCCLGRMSILFRANDCFLFLLCYFGPFLTSDAYLIVWP